MFHKDFMVQLWGIYRSNSKRMNKPKIKVPTPTIEQILKRMMSRGLELRQESIYRLSTVELNKGKQQITGSNNQEKLGVQSSILEIQNMFVQGRGSSN